MIDVDNIRDRLNPLSYGVDAYERYVWLKEQIKGKNKYEIVNVIFNGPATIVFWRDGTKTVVKRAIGDPFSEDAGVALCIAKKMMGDGFHRALRDAVKKGRMNRRRLIRNEK